MFYIKRYGAHTCGVRRAPPPDGAVITHKRSERCPPPRSQFGFRFAYRPVTSNVHTTAGVIIRILPAGPPPPPTKGCTGDARRRTSKSRCRPGPDLRLITIGPRTRAPRRPPTRSPPPPAYILKRDKLNAVADRPDVSTARV